VVYALRPNFCVQGDVPANHFYTVDDFQTKNLCSRISSIEVRFYRNRPFCVFEPLWGLRGNVWCSS